MVGDYEAGDYETPDGQCVHVFRSFGGLWAYTIAAPGGKKISAEELTPGVWRTLRPRGFSAPPGVDAPS